MIYFQEFVGNELPPEFSNNQVGGAKANLYFSGLTFTNMFGYLDARTDANAPNDSGSCIVLDQRMTLQTNDTLRYKWRHSHHASHRYQFGAFQTLAYTETDNLATLCCNGSQFGLLTKNPGVANQFIAFSTAPQDGFTYQCRLERFTSAIKLELLDEAGTLIETITQSSDLPQSTAPLYVGAKVLKNGNRTTAYALYWDSIAVQKGIANSLI